MANNTGLEKRWSRAIILALALANVFQFLNTRNDLKQASSNSSPMLQRRELQVDGIETVPTPLNDIPGWAPIYVYYGETNKLDEGHKFHSQVSQDRFIIRLLKEKRNGYFIDLAANEAMQFSNTFTLEKHYDWNGLCIEPNSSYWYDLALRKCQVVGSLVGKNDDEEVSVRFNGVFGGITNKAEDGNPEYSRRRTASLRSIFKKFHVPKKIDYLSLDVEGAEELIMTNFPFAEYQFDVLTIERVSAELAKFLKRNGYVLIHHFRRFDSMWVHRSLYYEGMIKEHSLTPKFEGSPQYAEWKRRNKIDG